MSPGIKRRACGCYLHRSTYVAPLPFCDPSSRCIFYPQGHVKSKSHVFLVFFCAAVGPPPKDVLCGLQVTSTVQSTYYRQPRLSFAKIALSAEAGQDSFLPPWRRNRQLANETKKHACGDRNLVYIKQTNKPPLRTSLYLLLSIKPQRIICAPLLFLKDKYQEINQNTKPTNPMPKRRGTPWHANMIMVCIVFCFWSPAEQN